MVHHAPLHPQQLAGVTPAESVMLAQGAAIAHSDTAQRFACAALAAGEAAAAAAAAARGTLPNAEAIAAAQRAALARAAASSDLQWMPYNTR